MGRNGEVTEILSDPSRASELLPLVYEELRKLAAARMAMERRGHTLTATALVSEAYLRLVGGGGMEWASRAQFFHAAAEAMRRILIEYARRHGAVKRGGEWKRVVGSVAELAAEDPAGIVALDGAFVRLEGVDPRAADVVRLRFYAGLTVEQTAAALGISARSVMRDWEYARAWLLGAVDGGDVGGGADGG